MKRILGIGNALTDVLLQVNDESLGQFNLPKGSMQLVDAEVSAALKAAFADVKKTMVAGGSASNTINGIACMGGHSAFIGKVGKDEIGDFFVADTRKNGVVPMLQISKSSASGNCTVLISPDGERTMCTYLGASSELAAADLKPEMFAGYDVLHIEGYLLQNYELITEAARMAKAAGLLVSVDFASYNVVEANLDFLKKYVAEYVDIVFANEEESHAFTGQQPEEALNTIAEMCQVAVVKVGKKGSFVKQGDTIYKIDAIAANCVDTTGAGDLYAAGFLYGWACGFDLQKCGKLGAFVSGKVVEVIGPKMSAETWELIKNQL